MKKLNILLFMLLPLLAIAQQKVGNTVGYNGDCDDLEYVGNYWLLDALEDGIQVDYWQPEARGGTAAAFQPILTTFSANAGLVSHVNGSPDATWYMPSGNIATSSSAFWSNIPGATDNTATNGSDQMLLTYHIYSESQTLFDDINTNTGEICAVWIDKCCSGNLELIMETTVPTGGAVPAAKDAFLVPAGKHRIIVALADQTAWMGYNLSGVQSYRSCATFDCRPAFRCNDEDLIVDGLTGEAVPEEAMWCEPTCDIPPASGSGDAALENCQAMDIIQVIGCCDNKPASRIDILNCDGSVSEGVPTVPPGCAIEDFSPYPCKEITFVNQAPTQDEAINQESGCNCCCYDDISEQRPLATGGWNNQPLSCPGCQCYEGDTRLCFVIGENDLQSLSMLGLADDCGNTSWTGIDYRFYFIWRDNGRWDIYVNLASPATGTGGNKWVSLQQFDPVGTECCIEVDRTNGTVRWLLNGDVVHEVVDEKPPACLNVVSAFHGSWGNDGLSSFHSITACETKFEATSADGNRGLINQFRRERNDLPDDYINPDKVKE